MLIKVKRGWELSENLATSEKLFMNRRQISKAIAASSLLSMPGLLTTTYKTAASEKIVDSSLVDKSVAKNKNFTLDRPITPEKYATTYNNYYEFGSHKSVWKQAQKLTTNPWKISVNGMVEEEFQMDIEDLLKKVDLEERLYRHRCVEAWSMAVPWIGFPMKQLVKIAKPKANAKYVVMRTISESKSEMPGLKQFWYPWPYTEALTIDEAINELAFIVTGMYGKPIPPQNGAPLRLAVPWKYGFKSIKSIISFSFTKHRPKTFWEALAEKEYGFWANVNPKVDHPRWSQASEWMIGGSKNDLIPTQLFNGYGESVAYLYKNLENEDLYR
jgi:sulfoxide reductase catalytic subunit YedY